MTRKAPIRKPAKHPKPRAAKKPSTSCTASRTAGDSAPTSPAAPSAISVLASVKETLQEGLAHHKANRLNKAAYSYRRVLEAEPENPDALHLLGVVVLAQGDPVAAIELIEASAAIAPKRASILFHLGEAYHAAGRLVESLAAFEATVETEAGKVADAGKLRPSSTVEVGIALQIQDRMEDALDSYRTALTLRPDFFRQALLNISATGAGKLWLRLSQAKDVLGKQ